MKCVTWALYWSQITEEVESFESVRLPLSLFLCCIPSPLLTLSQKLMIKTNAHVQPSVTAWQGQKLTKTETKLLYSNFLHLKCNKLGGNFNILALFVFENLAYNYSIFTLLSTFDRCFQNPS